MRAPFVIFGAICYHASAAPGYFPAVQLDDEMCLLQAARGNIKTMGTAALQTGAEVRQVPLGTNVVVQSGKKSEVQSGGKTDVKVQHSESSEDSLPLSRYTSGKSDKTHNTLVSRPISRRDAFIIQTGSKVRSYRRQIPVEDLPSDQLQDGTATVKLEGEVGSAQEMMSPQISSKVRQVEFGSFQATHAIPLRHRFKDQCATFAIICSLINHENAFAIAASSFIFVLLAGAWAAACFFGFGCSCSTTASRSAFRRSQFIKDRDLFKSNDGDKLIRQLTASSMNSDISGAGLGNFQRQISQEAVQAVAVFARQFTPEATTPELEEAFSMLKRQITPDVGHLPKSALEAYAHKVGNVAASKKSMQAKTKERTDMEPDPEALPTDDGEKKKRSKRPPTDGAKWSSNDRKFDKKWRSCGQGP